MSLIFNIIYTSLVFVFNLYLWMWLMFNSCQLSVCFILYYLECKNNSFTNAAKTGDYGSIPPSTKNQTINFKPSSIPTINFTEENAHNALLNEERTDASIPDMDKGIF